MVSFPKYQTLLGETPPHWVAKLPSSEEFSCHSRGTNLHTVQQETHRERPTKKVTILNDEST